MRKKAKLIFGFAIFVVLGLWILAPFVVEKLFSTWAERGQFGDLFGSVNALFSGLAFVALIYTIYLQREELALQREELRLQREEMAASRGELAAQVDAQKSLVRATISQIKVSAEQARIEAWKSEFGRQKFPNSDLLYNIKNAADNIDAIANELENN